MMESEDSASAVKTGNMRWEFVERLEENTNATVLAPGTILSDEEGAVHKVKNGCKKNHSAEACCKKQVISALLLKKEKIEG